MCTTKVGPQYIGSQWAMPSPMKRLTNSYPCFMRLFTSLGAVIEGKALQLYKHVV